MNESFSTKPSYERDFIRAVSQDLNGIPRERVISSASTLEYCVTVPPQLATEWAHADYIDDGTGKAGAPMARAIDSPHSVAPARALADATPMSSPH